MRHHVDDHGVHLLRYACCMRLMTLAQTGVLRVRPCRCAHEQVKHMHEVRDVQSAHVWSPLLGGHTPPCWEHAWRGGEVDGHPTHPEVARLRALATAVGAVMGEQEGLTVV